MKKNVLWIALSFIFLASQTVQAQSDWQKMPLKGNWKFSHVAVCNQGDVARERLAQIFQDASAIFNEQDVTFAYPSEDGFKNYPLKYKWNNASKLITLDFSLYENVGENPQTFLLTQIYKARINAGKQLELFFVIDNAQPDANTKPDYVLTFIAN
jgi:hypothetical protein